MAAVSWGEHEWGEAGRPGWWKEGVRVSSESHGKPPQCLAHSRCLVGLAALIVVPSS